MNTQVYTCRNCGKETTQPRTKGQQPKWCPDCRTLRLTERRCPGCGKTTPIPVTRTWCSPTCKTAHQHKPTTPTRAIQPTLTFDPRSPLRRGYEEGDPRTFFEGLHTRVTITPTACWNWTGRLSRDGYPRVNWSSRSFDVHRLVIEMTHGKKLGSQAAHHTCGNSTCVNPEHLQPVTHRENTAEMLARNSYIRRIRELEAALAELDPTHPLLDTIEVA